MNWLLFLVYASYTSNTVLISGSSNLSMEGVYETQDACQTGLEAYAKKSGASEITLVCIQGESFKPVPQRVHPKAEK